MINHLLDLLNNEPMTEHDRLEAKEALQALTSSDESVTIRAKERAADRLKKYATEAWFTIAAPVLRSLLMAELQKRLGLPPP